MSTSDDLARLADFRQGLSSAQTSTYKKPQAKPADQSSQNTQDGQNTATPQDPDSTEPQTQSDS